MVRCQQRRSLLFQSEQSLETVDVRVDLFVGQRVFGHAIPLQERIGLETVEAKDQPQLMVSQDSPPKQVDGERLANRRGKVATFGLKLLLNFRG